MKAKTLFSALAIAMALSSAYGQITATHYRKFYAGSTFFVLGNLSSKNRPDFVQLNFGYRFSPKDVVSVEAKT